MKSDHQNDRTEASTVRPRHQRIRQEAGPAVGLISGINHLVMFAEDMDESVRFYRDLLGLRAVRTQRFTSTASGLRKSAQHSSGAATEAASVSDVAVEVELTQVFFEMGNGELFSLYQAPEVSTRPDAPVSSVLWPEDGKARCSRPVLPQKLDHLAFDVASHEQVEWFREHLISQGVSCSDVTYRMGHNNTHRFISSIYFFDPSGNPLEIASFNRMDPSWQSYDFSDWFMDDKPVAALVDTDADEPTLTPRWLADGNQR